MDTQAVNNTGNPTTQKLIQVNSSPLSEKGSAPHSSVSTGDKVNLSQEAQSLVRRDRASANTIKYADGEQKKFSVTDNNDIVVEVIDPETQEVVRTVPSEEELELRDAIRNELDKV
jgi:uncharacterized FlaG/YvyC family protein